jgi:protein-S-isoprenylcysteine O-methyltransferase Ste14
MEHFVVGLKLVGGVLFLLGFFICVNWYIFWQRNYDGSLITFGMYSWVRHPFYSGFLMLVTGLTMILPVYETRILAIISFAVIFVYIPKEEEALLQLYKNKYKEYMEKVQWKIIPGIL